MRPLVVEKINEVQKYVFFNANIWHDTLVVNRWKL